jgi:uncharacterized circularly permuted ATP-grasp superfamily protein
MTIFAIRELRSDSALGVPGCSTPSAGNVMVANAWAAVLESAAWLGFIPGAADQLLGER